MRRIAGGLRRARWRSGEAATEVGATARNGAQIGRGLRCIEAATEAKEDPASWKRQQATAQEMGDGGPGGAPLEEADAAWRIREERGR